MTIFNRPDLGLLHRPWIGLPDITSINHLLSGAGA